ncbi:MAG: HPP family protein [Gammaproteobacteria bacterium]
MIATLSKYLGIESYPVSHTERLVSALGSTLVIACVFFISRASLGPTATLLIVPSMGASAVLLFAVPHGALSQPWNVFGGHALSAIIGVSCAMLFSNEIIAASAAVGIAVGVMHYLRCIHPPGGATALAAVIGGEATHALGYQFVFTPVMLNALVMLAVAVAFNFVFPWRRYPAWLADKNRQAVAEVPRVSERHIEHADLVAALGQIDSFIDVSENDLLRIYQLATGEADQRHLLPGQILQGHYYSSVEHGEDWSVRQIVDESQHPDPEKDRVVYKVVAGAELKTSGVVTRTEFARWATHELARDGKDWKHMES